MREFKGDWRDLFFGFRIALDLRKIFLSFVGVIFTIAGLIVILFLGVGFDQGKDFTALIAERQLVDAGRAAKTWAISHFVTPTKQAICNPLSAPDFFFPTVVSKQEGSVWPTLVLLACILWMIFVWSKFGGAISRIAAVEIAKDERITTHEALQFAKKKYSSFFWSPVSILIAFFFFYLVNTVGGLLGWIPFLGPILVGLISILAFLGGFVMLLIAIGGIFGWPLMAPAVSAEGTDAFDAVSRAFSYVYSRPWQYAFYWIVGGVYGIFCVGFVWVFTLLMVNLTFSSAQLGMGKTLDPAIRTIFSFGESTPFKEGGVGAGIMTVLLGTLVVLIYGLGFSFLVSFFFSLRSLMYFILRKRVDNTEMTEVYLEDEEEDLFEEGLDFEEGEEEAKAEAKAEAKEESGEKAESAPEAEKAEDKPPAEGEGEKPKEEPKEEKKEEPGEEKKEKGK
ncbi:MAG: hypothetical protein ACYTHM_02540 [Planctomycetota bacterium]|jgi:hypothetical protein